MRLSCCLRQWISAPTARSTAAVGAAPLVIAHARVPVDVSLHVSSQSHCQNQLSLVKVPEFLTLKTHLLNLTSDWNIIFVVSYQQKVCRQNSATADSFCLSFQCFFQILANIFSSSSTLSGATSGITTIIMRAQYLSVLPQCCDNVCGQRLAGMRPAHNGIFIVKFTEARC